MPIISKLAKGIGSGIGLASEAIAHHKEKSRLEKDETLSPDPDGRSRSRSRSPHPPGKHDDSDSDDLEPEEEDWALDDAATELTSPPPYESSELKGGASPKQVDEIVRSFLEHHPSVGSPASYKPLPYPVIIPQRRPKARVRGFVRAYAPILGECSGIDEATFMKFLQDFDAALKVRCPSGFLFHRCRPFHIDAASGQFSP